MTIYLNDKPHEVTEGTTLDVFLEASGVPAQGVAVAIRYEVVPKAEWHSTVLEEGTELMIIQAVSGG